MKVWKIVSGSYSSRFAIITEEICDILCRKVFDNGWQAQFEEQLRQRILQKIIDMDLATVQSCMEHVRPKLRVFEDHRRITCSLEWHNRLCSYGINSPLLKYNLIKFPIEKINPQKLYCHTLLTQKTLWCIFNPVNATYQLKNYLNGKVFFSRSAECMF